MTLPKNKTNEWLNVEKLLLTIFEPINNNNDNNNYQNDYETNDCIYLNLFKAFFVCLFIMRLDLFCFNRSINNQYVCMYSWNYNTNRNKMLESSFLKNWWLRHVFKIERCSLLKNIFFFTRTGTCWKRDSSF